MYSGGVNGNGCCCCCKGGGGGGGGGGGDNGWSSPVDVVVQGCHGEDPGSRGVEIEEVDAVVEEVEGCGAVGTPHSLQSYELESEQLCSLALST